MWEDIGVWVGVVGGMAVVVKFGFIGYALVYGKLDPKSEWTADDEDLKDYTP
jgi:hypothetical protein